MKIRIGMIGAGGIARGTHAKALRALHERAVVTAVSDVNQEAAAALAKETGGARTYSRYEDLLAQEEVDAVLITTPNSLHSEMALAALQAGKHVLCEKPLATSATAAQQMVEAAEKKGLILMTALNNRFRADVQYVKTQIQEGNLGHVYHAKCGWVRRSGIPGWGGWFTNKALSGGGPLIDLGVHMLDMTMYLLGDPKVASVTGQTHQGFGARSTSRAWGVANPNGTFDVEDFATALIRLEDGRTISLDTSWALNCKEEQTFVHVFGEKAGAQISNQHELALFGEENGQLTDHYPGIGYEDLPARIAMWENFFGSIDGTAVPLASGETGRRVNLILDAIYESSQTNREVRLSSL